MSKRPNRKEARRLNWLCVSKPEPRITLAKILPSGAQQIKTVKKLDDGRCLEQTKIGKNLVVETVSLDMEVDQRIAELTANGYEIIGK